MELNQGQQAYILEQLSYEYTIPEAYYPSLKQAMARYATTNYSDDELNFLLKTPQSIASTLMLNTTNSLQVFAKYYALWLNCFEYNMCENNSLVDAIIINPDPTSLEKLLQVINHGDQYQVIAVPQLRYTAHPRATQPLPITQQTERRIKPTSSVSIWHYRTVEDMMFDFLDFANQSDIIAQSAQQTLSTQDYVSHLDANLQRSLTKQLTWSQLRQRCQDLFTIDPTYVFADRNDGLIMPTNIQFINYLNARPVKRPSVAQHKPMKASVPANPFAPQIRLLHKFKENFKPQRMAPNFNTMKPPKFPFPFGNHQHHTIKKVSNSETDIPNAQNPQHSKPTPTTHHACNHQSAPQRQIKRVWAAPGIGFKRKHLANNPKKNDHPSKMPNHLNYKPL